MSAGTLIQHLNPDEGLPYAPGMPSFSEPSILLTLALTAEGNRRLADPLVFWILKTRNADGSIGLSREAPTEGLWNSSLLAIAMHRLGLKAERDSAVEFILNFRSIQVSPSRDNDVNTRLIGWPWVAHTFGWVEPTAWALIALALAGKSDHPRAVEGRRLLEDRCIPGGGWNYGNKVVYGHSLMPFWDSTALALLAIGDLNRELLQKNLDLLEKSQPEIQSLLCNALLCLCFERFGRKADLARERITGILSQSGDDDLNFAHAALAYLALSGRRVLSP